MKWNNRQSQLSLLIRAMSPEELENIRNLDLVKKCGVNIMRIPENKRNPEVCLAAAKQNGLALGFMQTKHKTPEVCLAAVNRCGDAIHFVPEKLKTQEVCIAAVQNDGMALQFIFKKHQRTVPVCIAALRQTLGAISLLNQKELDIPEVQNEINALRQQENQENEVCKTDCKCDFINDPPLSFSGSDKCSDDESE